MKRALLVVLLALGGVASAQARTPEPLSFLSSIEPSEVELGRPFVLRVEVRHRQSERYRLPEELDLAPAVLRGVEQQSSEAEGVVETVFSIEAVIFDALGEVELPDLRLLAEDEEGALESLALPGATLRIRESGEGVELEPPPAPMAVRVFAWERLALAAGGLLLIVALYYLGRRWWAGRPAAPGPTPLQRARAELEALRAEALWERGQARLHYFRLSETFRLYLRDDHEVEAVEMTSEELVAALWRAPIPGLSAERAEAWLRRGDLARFAKGEVGAEQALRDLEEAEAMLEAMEAARLPAAEGGEP